MAMSGPFLAVTIITIVLGILNCFFGYWWFRVGLIICGLIIGAIIGAIVSFFTAPQHLLLMMILFAIGFAVLFGLLKKVGLFVLCFFAGSGIVSIPIISTYLAAPLSTAARFALEGVSEAFPSVNLTSPIIISVIIGLVVAIVAVIFEKPVVIILSAILGATMLAGVAASFFTNINTVLKTVITVVLAIVGILAQFGLFKKRH